MRLEPQWRRRRWTLWLAIAVVGCDQETAAPPQSQEVEPPAIVASRAPWLVDVTEEVGVAITHRTGFDGSYRMPEVLGSGAALADLDGDDTYDLVAIAGGRVTDEGGESELVVLRGSGGRFEEVARHHLGSFAMGTALGDVDRDGDLDLFVSAFGVDAFLRNEGGGFVDATAEAGLGDASWSTSAVFFDGDGDGWLDLWVVRYVEWDPEVACRSVSGRPEFCGPESLSGVTDLFYRNVGDGRFEEVGSEWGLSSRLGKGLGVALLDVDEDGRPDIYVANDGEENFLWINRGDRFEEEAVRRGAAVNLMGRREASMGTAVGDVDGDGHQDLFVTHLVGESDTLYRGVGDGFEDRTGGGGLGRDSVPFTGFGTVLVDLELDGDLDLLVATGKVRTEPEATQVMAAELDAPGLATESELGRAYGEANRVLLNDGTGRFEKACASEPSWCGVEEVSRGVLPGDLDRDGDLDIVVTNAAGPVRVYRNEVRGAGRWLEVSPLDPEGRMVEVGATVTVEVGPRRWSRLATHSFGYLTSGDGRVHFGLGDATEIDRLVVRWPFGPAECFPPPELDSRVAVRRAGGRPCP